MKKYIAEGIGTLVLTLFGCGVAAFLTWSGLTGFQADLPIAMAFGLSIVAMAYVIGDISGCHINPAVSLGVFLNGGMSAKDFAGYLVAQFIGGICGAAILALIISCGAMGGIAQTGLGCNGFGAGVSAVGLDMIGAIVVEIILTFVFVFTILGVTSNPKYGSCAGLVIGLTLTFVHLLGIPLTGTSVNPARSFGPALMMLTGGNTVPMEQVWVFIVAPLIGAAIAAGVFRVLRNKDEEKAEEK